MAELDLPMNFPRSVLREADQIDETITKEEIAKRRDFRKNKKCISKICDASIFKIISFSYKRKIQCL
jgi:ribonuclease R